MQSIIHHHIIQVLGSLPLSTSDVFDRVRPPCVPGRVRVDFTGFLDLAHGGASTTNTATKVGTASLSVHDVHGEGGDEGSPAEPEEEGGGLRQAAVLLSFAIAGEDGPGMGVVLRGVSRYSQNRSEALVLQKKWETRP
jgi:hypothetical protein